MLYNRNGRVFQLPGISPDNFADGEPSDEELGFLHRVLTHVRRNAVMRKTLATAVADAEVQRAIDDLFADLGEAKTAAA